MTKWKSVVPLHNTDILWNINDMLQYNDDDMVFVLKLKAQPLRKVNIVHPFCV